MDKNTILKTGFSNAFIAAAYITLVAIFIHNAEKIFGPSEDQPLTIVAMLLLLVISVAVMGITIFGRPLMWYLDGKKKEAVLLVFHTIFFLMILAVLIFSSLALRT